MDIFARLGQRHLYNSARPVVITVTAAAVQSIGSSGFISNHADLCNIPAWAHLHIAAKRCAPSIAGIRIVTVRPCSTAQHNACRIGVAGCVFRNHDCPEIIGFIGHGDPNLIGRHPEASLPIFTGPNCARINACDMVHQILVPHSGIFPNVDLCYFISGCTVPGYCHISARTYNDSTGKRKGGMVFCSILLLAPHFCSVPGLSVIAEELVQGGIKVTALGK